MGMQANHNFTAINRKLVTGFLMCLPCYLLHGSGAVDGGYWLEWEGHSWENFLVLVKC